MAKKSKHPFLFYGLEPGDWGEGPQLWLIRFIEPPDDGQLANLGELTAELLQGSALTVDRVEFAAAGPWAALTCDDSDPEPFAAAGELFTAWHGVAPVAEVILATAREPGYSGWDRWSEKQQELPSLVRGVLQESGDLQVRIDIFFRTRGTDDDYPARCEAEDPIPVAPSAAFDASFKAGRERLFQAELEQALASAKKSGKPALVPTAPGYATPPALSDELAERIGPHMAFGIAPGGRVVAVAPRAWPYHLAVLDPGADEARKIEVKQDLPTKYLMLSPGGGHVLLAAKRDLVEIDLETGEQQLLFQLPGHGPTAFSAGYLDSDDRILAQLDGEEATLFLRDGAGGELKAVASAKVKGVNIVTVQGRFGFLADKKKMKLVGVRGEKVAALGIIPIRLGSTVFAAELDGEQRIFVRQEGQVFEVVNLEAAYDKKLKK